MTAGYKDITDTQGEQSTLLTKLATGFKGLKWILGIIIAPLIIAIVGALIVAILMHFGIIGIPAPTPGG